MISFFGWILLLLATFFAGIRVGQWLVVEPKRIQPEMMKITEPRDELIVEIFQWFKGDEIIKTHCGRSRPYEAESLQELSKLIQADFADAKVLYVGEVYSHIQSAHFSKWGKDAKEWVFHVWACDDAQVMAKWNDL